MANTLGNYNVPLYANAALLVVKKSLGMATRVYRGYDEENRTHNKGSEIRIKKPGTFTATSEPSSASNITTESVTLALDQWKGCRATLTDKEVAQTERRIMEDHIPEMAYAVADSIDQSLWALYKDVPWQFNQAGSTMAIADILAARKQMGDNQVPLGNPAMIHFGIGTAEEADLLALANFSQWQGSGQVGVDTQQDAALRMRYGYNFFVTQNRTTHTPGVAADAVGAVVGAHAAGLTTLAIDSITTAGTVKAGDTLVITKTGYTQYHAITADATASVGAVTLSIYPGLQLALAGSEVVTLNLEATKKNQNLAFHRDAFALAFGKLPDYAEFPNINANFFTATDPVTGLSIRARVYLDNTNSAMYFGLDALWGVKTLNGNLAFRSCRTT
jgi:hypothetical protein